ncbi:MAG: ribose 5-phosphate isomerase B [Planctomycetota bacterium]|jgi:ribose 5-phosphate isomerase B|nr:ribose 5-phosphate isomerase B [Planctomycetota bacterium]
MVRQALLEKSSGRAKPLPTAVGKTQGTLHDFVNERTVVEFRSEGVLCLSPGAIVTPLARDMATKYKVRLQIVDTGTSSATSFRVAVGSDHAGFELKEAICKDLTHRGYKVEDVGTHGKESVDYPDFAVAVAKMVRSGHCRRGVFIDGAGIGGAMAANKISGVRAAHCRDHFEVKNSRTHNDANVLTLGHQGGNDFDSILELVRTWLVLPFEGGRHARRVAKIEELDRGW